MNRNRILVLGRINDTNLGDVVIADSCEYILNRIIDERNQRRIFNKIPHVQVANIYDTKVEALYQNITAFDKIVIPGGGINSLKFTRAVKSRMNTTFDVKFYFNGIGVHSSKKNPTLAKLISYVLNDSRVQQVTTRGDYEMTKKYITNVKKFSTEWVLDPAIWSGEAYGVEKDVNSDVIGIGAIRPGIFHEQDSSISEEDVLNMYLGLITRIEKSGHRWKMFCNGTERDYNFAKELLKEHGYDIAEHLLKRPTEPKILVEQIASFKGIIAARFHANIIATSLGIPTIALVWNEKMCGFSEAIGCTERYVKEIDKLLDAEFLVDALEKAMQEGYDSKQIESMKQKTIITLNNIVDDKIEDPQKSKE